MHKAEPVNIQSCTGTVHGAQSHPEELLAIEGCWGKKVIVFSDVTADEEWVVPHPSSLERPQWVTKQNCKGKNKGGAAEMAQ